MQALQRAQAQAEKDAAAVKEAEDSLQQEIDLTTDLRTQLVDRDEVRRVLLHT